MQENAVEPFTPEEVANRSLGRREIAYYGNVNVTDSLRIHVRIYRRGGAEAGFRYRIERESDGRLVALSEAIKRFPR
jgi:acyl-CoA thioesterase FadM